MTAIINGPQTQLNVNFDKALNVDGTLDFGNWAIRTNNLVRNVTFAGAAGTTVTLNLVAGGADVGIDRVTYSPPPDDVITLENQLPVLAFTDFPVT